MRFNPPKTRTVWVSAVSIAVALACQFLNQPLPAEHSVWFTLGGYALLFLGCLLRGL